MKIKTWDHTLTLDPTLNPVLDLNRNPTLTLSCFRRGLVISASLCMSPCSSDYIFTCLAGAWRIVSEDSKVTIWLAHLISHKALADIARPMSKIVMTQPKVT